MTFSIDNPRSWNTLPPPSETMFGKTLRTTRVEHSGIFAYEADLYKYFVDLNEMQHDNTNAEILLMFFCGIQ